MNAALVVSEIAYANWITRSSPTNTQSLEFLAAVIYYLYDGRFSNGILSSTFGNTLMILTFKLPRRWPFRRPRAFAILSLLLLMLASGILAAAPFDQVKITSTPTQAADEFGFSVALSGKTLLAGAPRRDESPSDSGAAFVFDQQANGAWTQVRKLAPADLAADDSFGWAVAISDDTAIVGSRSDDDGATTSGSAYIFERNHGGAQNWGRSQSSMHPIPPRPINLATPWQFQVPPRL